MLREKFGSINISKYIIRQKLGVKFVRFVYITNNKKNMSIAYIKYCKILTLLTYHLSQSKGFLSDRDPASLRPFFVVRIQIGSISTRIRNPDKMARALVLTWENRCCQASYTATRRTGASRLRASPLRTVRLAGQARRLGSSWTGRRGPGACPRPPPAGETGMESASHRNLHQEYIKTQQEMYYI